MNVVDYIAEIVEPAFVDFQRNPNSPRHAYLACVTLTHVVDRLVTSDDEAKKLRKKWTNLSKEFLIVDEVAQYFKHGTRNWVKKAKLKNPTQLLITNAIGLENGGLKEKDLHNLYFQVRDALDFVRGQASYPA